MDFGPGMLVLTEVKFNEYVAYLLKSSLLGIIKYSRVYIQNLQAFVLIHRFSPLKYIRIVVNIGINFTV